MGEILTEETPSSFAPAFKDVASTSLEDTKILAGRMEPSVGAAALFKSSALGPNLTQIISDGASLAMNHYMYKDLPKMSVEEQKKEFGFDYGEPMNPIQARFKARRKQEEIDMSRISDMYGGNEIAKFFTQMAGNIFYDPAGMLVGIGAGKVLEKATEKLAINAFKNKFASQSLKFFTQNPIGQVVTEGAMETAVTAPLEAMRNKQIGTEYTVKNLAWMFAGNVLGNAVGKGLNAGLEMGWKKLGNFLDKGNPTTKAEVLNDVHRMVTSDVPIREDLIESKYMGRLITDGKAPPTTLDSVHTRNFYGPTILGENGRGIHLTANKEMAIRAGTLGNGKVSEVNLKGKFINIADAPNEIIGNKLLSILPDIINAKDIPEGINERIFTQPLEKTIDEIVEAAGKDLSLEERLDIKDHINEIIKETGIQGYRSVDGNNIESMYLFDKSPITSERLGMEERFPDRMDSTEIDDYINNHENNLHHTKFGDEDVYSNPIPNSQELNKGIVEEWDELSTEMEKVSGMTKEEIDRFSAESQELDDAMNRDMLNDEYKSTVPELKGSVDYANTRMRDLGVDEQFRKEALQFAEAEMKKELNILEEKNKFNFEMDAAKLMNKMMKSEEYTRGVLLSTKFTHPKLKETIDIEIEKKFDKYLDDYFALNYIKAMGKKLSKEEAQAIIKEMTGVKSSYAQLKNSLQRRLKKLEELKIDTTKESEGIKAMYVCMTKGK